MASSIFAPILVPLLNNCFDKLVQSMNLENKNGKIVIDENCSTNLKGVFAGGDDAKQRNLERVMHVLSGKAGHFMGRDWRDGK